MIAFAVIVALAGLLFFKLPGSFVPEEDQGYGLLDVQLPPGATIERTLQVLQQIDKVLRQNPAVDFPTLVAGASFTGNGENGGRSFVKLMPYSRRHVPAPGFIPWGN